LTDSLSLVAQEVSACTLCPLSASRTNAVPGEGPPDAKVMLVGEGPGRNEDLQGRPFVGAAGKGLDSLLAEAGLKREEVFICNVVKCRPPENRRPTTEEVEACAPYLDRQIALIRPRIIVLLGDTALKRFFPDRGLAGSHGRLLSKGSFEFFSSYHPAAMIYNAQLEATIRADFRALGERVRGYSALLRPEE
jgi:uracil-DNA glycosylase